MTSLRVGIPRRLEEPGNGLTDRFRALLYGLWDDLLTLDQRIETLDGDIEYTAKSDPVAQRLQQLRGVGPLVATSLIATVGNGDQFSKGRQMAASVGLTPRQHSSGGKDRLLGISKRGDAYLRTILIHGARSVVAQARHKEDRLRRWVTGLAERRHPNVAAVKSAYDRVHQARPSGWELTPEWPIVARHQRIVEHLYLFESIGLCTGYGRIIDAVHSRPFQYTLGTGDESGTSACKPSNVPY